MVRTQDCSTRIFDAEGGSPCSIAEACTKEDVCVRKEPLFERHDYKLAARKARLEELPNVLRMGEIQGGVDLIKNVHRRRLELQQ